MLSGVRFRAYPNATVAAGLRVWIGHQRFTYNAKVREQRYFRTFARHQLALTGCQPLPDQAYSQFISPDTAFLREVPAQILRNGAYRFACGSARALKGLSRAPTIRKKHGRQSVMLTSELFRFIEQIDPKTGAVRHHLMLGTQKFTLGRLPFKAHRPYEVPKSISVSVEPDGRWFVSFCYETPDLDDTGKPVVLRTPEELAYEFGLRADLEDIVEGIDRGVAQPFATSSGKVFHINPACSKRIEKKEKRAKRYQRQMARQQKGSKNRAKTRRRIARLKGYGKNVREDFAHKTSHELAASDTEVFALEDLKLQSMTAAPAPKQDAAGRYTANGAAAKAGLNKALLANALGKVATHLTYKAARRNKLVLRVPAAYSSQECAECGHVDAANRPSQAEFRCTACGHRDNADHNAARVLKHRAVAMLREQRVVFRQKKTGRVRGKKVGSVRPEPKGVRPSTPVENLSAVASGQPANDALFDEAGNRHYTAHAVSGR